MNRLHPSVRHLAECSGKFPYPTRAIATRIAARMRRVRDRVLGVYRCGGCGRWHVGNSGIIKKPKLMPYNRTREKREVFEEDAA